MADRVTLMAWVPSSWVFKAAGRKSVCFSQVWKEKTWFEATFSTHCMHKSLATAFLLLHSSSSSSAAQAAHCWRIHLLLRGEATSSPGVSLHGALRWELGELLSRRYDSGSWMGYRIPLALELPCDVCIKNRCPCLVIKSKQLFCRNSDVIKS